ncbi:MAG: ABC transporter transmembrane domain-containing protein, partial [Anaerolineae bacterium]
MKDILTRFWKYVFYIGLISFVLNVLMLTPAFFMLSVFDKVLPSRSTMTLLVLLGIALYALAAAGVLYSLQIRLFDRFGATFKKQLAPRVLELALRGVRQPELARHGLDDVNELESFLTGQGIKAFFELPWIPIFIVVLYLFHLALAATALILTLILFALAIAEDRLTAAHQKRASELARRASTFAFVARQNAETVGSLGMQSAIKQRWERLNDEALDHGGRAARTSSRIQGMAKFVRMGGQMLGLAVGTYLLLNVQGVSAGIMIASLLIMGRAMAPVDHVIAAWKSFVNARGAYERLGRLLTEAEAAQLA